MHSMIEFHPRPDALDGLGLPAIPYPVALPAFQAAVANDGDLPLADMLHGLQLRAALPDAHWQRMEPAMARLAELLAPDDARETVIAEGADWWLELGPVEPARAVLALRRGDVLLAAIAPREDGRLRVAAWRPLDGHALQLLLDLAALPRGEAAHPDASARWQQVRDALPADAPADATGAGLSWLSRWPADPGQEASAMPDPANDGAEPQPRRPACVAAEISTFDLRRRAPR